jgi:dipeptide transport system substrate-binding protein
MTTIFIKYIRAIAKIQSFIRGASIAPLVCVGCIATMAYGQETLATSPEKSLVFCVGGNPKSFFPGIDRGHITADANRQIYSRIVEFEPEGTQLVLGLAERWTASPDGTEYTFFLRKDAQWHSNSHFIPSRTLNADDVIFTMERQWKESHPFYRVTSSIHAEFIQQKMDKQIKSIGKVDEHTVKITLNNADASFVSNLALSWAGVQSKEYADLMLAAGTPEKVDQEPIGTGPFTMVEYKRDAFIRYKAFPQYFLGVAKIDRLTFSITPNPSESWAKLQKGACDVMGHAYPDDLEAMRQHPDVTVLEQVESSIGYLAYNTTKKPFDDVRVRKAINMAINKKSIVNGVYLDSGVLANSPIPPTQWSHNDAVIDDPFDPVAARKLLSDAGYPDGFTTDLWVMPVSRRYNPDPRRLAALIKTNLAKIGVNVEFKTYEWREYTRRMRNGEHQMGMSGWFGDNGDPDNYFDNLLGCPEGKPSESNLALFCYPPMEALLQQARRATEPAARSSLYQAAQVMFKEQAPWFTIAYSLQFKAVHKGVVNFRLHPLGFHDFYRVDKTN